MNRDQKDITSLIARREKAPKRPTVSVSIILLVAVTGIAAAQPADETTSVKKEATERTVELQKITALSSMQFYTHFALVRNMLKGEWDDKLFAQFSSYDGMNLQMMQRYEEELKGDRTWGPFLKMKNSLHRKVYDDLEPLIRKKRMNQNLTAADLKELEALDKLILEKLIK
jgi:hypothetical protein